MKLVALYSGGKDSTYAIWKAQNLGHEIDCLLTMLPERKDSYMYHVPNIHLTKLGAEAMDLSLIYCSTTGEKEKELSELEEALGDLKRERKIEGVLSGAVASRYQASRIASIAKRLGVKCMNPLWGRNNSGLLEEMVSNGFEVMVVGVFAGGLGKEWLGRIIGEVEIEELKKLNQEYGISPLGEGGELETLVTDCPLYRKRIAVKKAVKEWSGLSGEFRIIEAELEEK